MKSHCIQVSTLLDSKTAEEYAEEVAREYQEMREEHYASLQNRKFLPLEKARAKSLSVDWKNKNIIKPSFLGQKVNNMIQNTEVLGL